MAQQTLKILVVDSNSIAREADHRYLHQAASFNCIILEAELGTTGLTLCQQVQPDVVLLDDCLPDLNGLEFLTQIKTQMGESVPPLNFSDGVGQ